MARGLSQLATQPERSPAVVPEAKPGGWAGEIVTAPDADDVVEVVIAAFSSERPELCRYVAAAGTPSPGDACTVVFPSGGGLPIAIVPGTIADRVVRGIVSDAGAIIKGSGFSVTRAGTGDYTITFSPAFSDVPSIPAPGIRSAATVYASLTSTVPTESSFRVGIFNMDAPFANVDAEFHFVAIGPA